MPGSGCARLWRTGLILGLYMLLFPVTHALPLHSTCVDLDSEHAVGTGSLVYMASSLLGSLPWRVDYSSQGRTNSEASHSNYRRGFVTAHINDESNATILASFAVFVIFTSAFLVYLFMNSTLHIVAVQRKKPRQDRTVSPLGFGFEGLSQQELMHFKEENLNGEKFCFVDLPRRPPPLVFKHRSSSPPLTRIDFSDQVRYSEKTTTWI